MTNPIEPATDEEISQARNWPQSTWESMLIARFDAEKARAEKAEAERDRLRAVIADFVEITGRENKITIPAATGFPRFVSIEFDPDLLTRARALLTPPTEKDPHR